MLGDLALAALSILLQNCIDPFQDHGFIPFGVLLETVNIGVESVEVVSQVVQQRKSCGWRCRGVAFDHDHGRQEQALVSEP